MRARRNTPRSGFWRDRPRRAALLRTNARRGVGSLLHVVDDAPKGVRLEAGAADEGAVDVGARHQVVDVVVVDRATVLDHHRVGNLLAVVLDEPAADVRVRLLRHLGRRREAGADGPHRLVRDDDVLHHRRVHPRQSLGELRGANVERLAGLALLLELADAEDGLEPARQDLEHLLVHVRVRVAEDRPPLRVAGQHIVGADALDHRGRDRAREGARVLPVAVLRAEADLAASQRLLDRNQERGRHAHRHVDAGRLVRLCRDGLRERHSLVEVRVHLPVARHERSARHHGRPAGGAGGDGGAATGHAHLVGQR
mmetsp:Transcript_28638/g.91721  ORF Transcript_28638/g.91721 Transcript_28638/m.91721 type:complete len:312 (+) Transcript_28638:246-1181(+)